MQCTVMRDAGFRIAVDHALRADRQGFKSTDIEVLASTVAGTNAREFSENLLATRLLNRDTKRPAWHFTFDAMPECGMDSRNWNEFLARFLSRIELDPQQTLYLATRHANGEKAHLVASSISLAGRAWPGRLDIGFFNEVARSIHIAQHEQMQDAQATEMRQRVTQLFANQR